VITASDLTITFPNSKHVAFSQVSFSLKKGDCTLLTGSTGSGKSTLIKSLVGLIPHYIAADIDGELLLDGVSIFQSKPAQLSRKIGYVPQNPFQSFVTDSVEDEIAFTLESHAVSPLAMRERVEELLDVFDLTLLRTRAPRLLSTGEAQRLAIAAATALQPDYLILDEPISALDQRSAEFVISFLHTYSKNHGVLVAEHRKEALAPISTSEITLDSPLLFEPYKKMPGNISLIVGENGSGKTTYLERYVAASTRKIGYVPQNPAELFLTQSVQAECALTPGSQRNLTSLAPYISESTHPRDLSEGEKLLLALSIAAALGEDEIVLDEPTRGLDPQMKQIVMTFLSQLDLPVLIATHDGELINAATGEVRRIEELLRCSR